MTYIYDQFGVIRKVSHLQIADRLFELKKQSGSKPWPVISACLKMFEEEHPQKYDSYINYIEDVKRTRKDPKFASTYDKEHGGYLRYTIDIPVKVHKMLRTIYNPDELPMTREFWIEFARRYPKYRIAEKL